MNRRRVYIATANEGKLAEFRTLLGAAGWEVQRWERYREPAEGEVSYAENAAIKARALAEQLRAADRVDDVLADDSGLEVAALAGRPGVLSARYGGDAASWSERRRELLREVDAAGKADRAARFVCALHFIAADGYETAVGASVDGRIPYTERGDGGFSYDAVFEYPPLGMTFAEIPREEKNRLSHRARAVRALLAALDGAS